MAKGTRLTIRTWCSEVGHCTRELSRRAGAMFKKVCCAQVGDEVLHIELTRWADVLVISPCSANYLAKMAHGLCDDLVMSVVRAWPPDKPHLLHLAMHASMWQHPVTSQHLSILNKQSNLCFVGAEGEALQSVDAKLFRPEYGATAISSVVAAIQKLIRGKGQHVTCAMGVRHGNEKCMLHTPPLSAETSQASET